LTLTPPSIASTRRLPLPPETLGSKLGSIRTKFPLGAG
jgi:hypothetical protein